MALVLPGWLVKAISYLGYDFPQTNEDVLHQWADHLKSMDRSMDAAHSRVVTAVRHVQAHNHGPGTDAFGEYVSGHDSDQEALVRFSQACEIAATGCDVCAYAVVVLKGRIRHQPGHQHGPRPTPHRIEGESCRTGSRRWLLCCGDRSRS